MAVSFADISNILARGVTPASSPLDGINLSGKSLPAFQSKNEEQSMASTLDRLASSLNRYLMGDESVQSDHEAPTDQLQRSLLGVLKIGGTNKAPTTWAESMMNGLVSELNQMRSDTYCLNPSPQPSRMFSCIREISST